MTTGLKIGDKLKIKSKDNIGHFYNIGSIVYIVDLTPGDPKRPQVTDGSGPVQWVHVEDTELIEEESMAEKRSNPKNFRNGDVIKVSGNKVSVHSSDALVFVKFGENYYNLSQGGQMKACRYLPPGTQEIITNLSGMGKFFLMSEEELEEQAGRPSGGSTISTNEVPGHSHTVTDFEYIMKMADSYIQTDTTEEKW